MSAIVGIFNRDGAPADPDILQRMLDAIAPYGPDGRGVWTEGPVGLGQLMLQLTPESRHERLPRAEGSLALTADARIDNRSDLIEQLGITGARDQLPDSSLILAAYARWGTQCPLHLIGDYAFAIWDGRKQTMFLSADHIASRPLYYVATARRIVFATDVRALWAHPDVVRRPNEAVIAAYLHKLPYNPGHEMFYEGVLKLPMGSWIMVDAERVRAEKYWFPFKLPPLRFKQKSEYVEALRELVTEAVACRVRTDHPIATHISAGLDSTSIAVLAARDLAQRGRQLVAGYSWAPPPSERWPQDEHDDRRLIDAAGQREGIPIEHVEATPGDFLRYLQRDPMVGGAPNYAAEVHVIEHAAARGVRLILSGWGGDEAISGSGPGALANWLLTGRWWRLARLYRQAAGRSRRDLKRALLLTVQPCLPDVLHRHTTTFRFDTMATFIDPDFARRADYERFQAPVYRLVPGVRRYQRRLLAQASLPDVPAVWAGLGANHGLSYAFPLLDRRVLEFAYTIPEELFIGPGRHLYRSAMEGIIPDEIRLRTKDWHSAHSYFKHRWWRATWQHLADQVRNGDWDVDIPWLDMPRLRRMLLDVPAGEALSVRDGLQFVAGMARAVEMRNLYERG